MISNRIISYQWFSKYRNQMMGISIIGILFCHYDECRSLSGMGSTKMSLLLSMGTCFVDVFLLLSGIGLFYSFDKNHRLDMFYKKRILRLLPTYLILAVPYWIYNDMILQHLGISSTLYDLTFLSMLFNGVHRFWFIFAIIILYFLFPAFFYILQKGQYRIIMFVLSIALSIIVGAIIHVCIPQIYGNLRIMIERIPIFIIGIYYGSKCKREHQTRITTVIILFLVMILSQCLIHIDALSRVGVYFSYYAASLLGLFMSFVMIIMFEQLSGTIFMKYINKVLAFLGTITLEIYLLHSMIKNLLGYPGDIRTYVVAVVLLPIPLAYFVHKICMWILRRVKNEI